MQTNDIKRGGKVSVISVFLIRVNSHLG